MEKLKFRYLIVIFMLVVTVVVVNSLQYDASLDEKAEFSGLQKIPLQIGKWIGQDYPLQEMVYEILETRAIMHRAYTADNGQQVFLSIVHYHDTKVDFHTPEACIGGRGLKTTKTNKMITFISGTEENHIDVAEMLTTMSTGQTLTYYFFKSGQFVGSSYIKMRLNIAANKLVKNDARGSLIRISTTVTPGYESEAETLLVAFIKDLFPYIQQSL